MGETYTGQVRNGVVVFDVDSPPLAEGTRGRVEPVVDKGPSRTLAERLQAIIGRAHGLPSDLARDHDHYLHGQPKR